MDYQYNSTLAELIQSAINECIGYGYGKMMDAESSLTVYAGWAENEKDIEVVIQQSGVSVISYTERGVIDKVY